jgi:hypothetical protein
MRLLLVGRYLSPEAITCSTSVEATRKGQAERKAQRVKQNRMRQMAPLLLLLLDIKLTVLFYR